MLIKNKQKMIKFSSINDRITQLIDFKANKNQKKFAEMIDFAPQVISNIVSGRKSKPSFDVLNAISSSFVDINPEWLLTGEGEMLKSDNLSVATQTHNPNEGIPLIPTEAMRGVASGEISILELNCERYVIPMFKDADFLIPVKGSSMYPKYNSGDVVACKRVPMQDIFFQWNKVYVLDTNQGAIIKRVAKSEQEGCIKIVSDNPSYEPFDLQLSQIYSIAIVVGVVRQE